MYVELIDILTESLSKAVIGKLIICYSTKHYETYVYRALTIGQVVSKDKKIKNISSQVLWSMGDNSVMFLYSTKKMMGKGK